MVLPDIPCKNKLFSGKPHLALKLALQSGDTNAMITAVESLGDRVDPELAHTLAAHLRQADHHSHAAALLATAGKVCIFSITFH